MHEILNGHGQFYADGRQVPMNGRQWAKCIVTILCLSFIWLNSSYLNRVAWGDVRSVK
jgi:hypothetical protein